MTHDQAVGLTEDLFSLDKTKNEEARTFAKKLLKHLAEGDHRIIRIGVVHYWDSGTRYVLITYHDNPRGVSYNEQAFEELLIAASKVEQLQKRISAYRKVALK